MPMNLDIDETEARQLFAALLASKFMSEKSAEIVHLGIVNRVLRQIVANASTEERTYFYDGYLSQAFNPRWNEEFNLNLHEFSPKGDRLNALKEICYPYKIDELVMARILSNADDAG